MKVSAEDPAQVVFSLWATSGMELWTLTSTGSWHTQGKASPSTPPQLLLSAEGEQLEAHFKAGLRQLPLKTFAT